MVRDPGAYRLVRALAVREVEGMIIRIAVGTIVAAQEDGVAVPAQLSVVGHDDIPLAEVLRPPLTTVRQPMRELGAQAVRLLHARLQLHDAPGEAALIRLTPESVVRGSTGPAPAPTL